MVSTRNVLVMASMLALWLLARCAGLEEKRVAKRRGKRGSIVKEEGL